MYNDVDMVWLADPFPYLQGDHDVYFTDDMTAVRTPTLLLTFRVVSFMLYIYATYGEWNRQSFMRAAIYYPISTLKSNLAYTGNVYFSFPLLEEFYACAIIGRANVFDVKRTNINLLGY